MKIPVFSAYLKQCTMCTVCREIDSTIKLTLFMIFYKFWLLKDSQFYIIIVPNILI